MSGGKTAVAGALVVLLGLALGGCVGCRSELQRGLTEAQADEVVLALDEAGIQASKHHRGGDGSRARFAIEVPSGDSGRALRVLRERGLPRAVTRGLAETYASSSMIPTPTEERARFLGALSGEIARMLEKLDGVDQAHVILARPDDDPLAAATLDPEGEAPRAATAAVVLRMRAGAPAPAVGAVQALVAGAAPGVAPASVSVALTTAPTAAPPRESAFAQVGPFGIARGSRSGLVAMLATLAALVVALAAAVLVLAWRLSGARRRVRALENGGERSRGTAERIRA